MHCDADTIDKKTDLTKSCFGNILEERTVLCEVETLLTSAKMTLWKSFVPFFRLCSARLLIEIHFALRKFVESHNNKSFIELACWKFMDLDFGQYLPNTDLTLVQ